MKKQKKTFKQLLKTGFLMGLFFATFMSVFDYIDKTPFSLVKFIISGSLFGFLMTYSQRFVKTNK